MTMRDYSCAIMYVSSGKGELLAALYMVTAPRILSRQGKKHTAYTL